MVLNRFEGNRGRQVLSEMLREQKIVAGDRSLAEQILEFSKPVSVLAGTQIIEQGSSSNELHLIVSGVFDIIVNGRTIAKRSAGDHVGEMSAIDPALPRSATVIAAESSVVVTLTEAQLSELSQIYPNIWRFLARELARRLLQRNRLITTTHERI